MPMKKSLGHRGSLPLVAGQWLTGVTQGTEQTTNFLDGDIRVRPIMLGDALAFDQIGMMVATAGGAGAQATLLIYDANPKGYPTDLITSAGPVALDVTGIRSTAINVTLSGLVWVGAWRDDAAADPTIHYDRSTYPWLPHPSIAPASYRAGFVSRGHASIPDPFPSGKEITEWAVTVGLRTT